MTHLEHGVVKRWPTEEKPYTSVALLTGVWTTLEAMSAIGYTFQFAPLGPDDGEGLCRVVFSITHQICAVCNASVKKGLNLTTDERAPYNANLGDEINYGSETPVGEIPQGTLEKLGRQLSELEVNHGDNSKD